MGWPTDPLAGQQWHLPLLGDLSRVWDNYTGAGITIALFDDGVEATHEDLAANVVSGTGVTLGGTTFTRLHLSAGDWHGTAVAGLIAAAAGNSLGGTGVAPGARISSLNFLEQVQFQPDATVLAALAWGGAHAIAHNSWIYAPHFGPGQSLADPAGWSSAV